MTTSEFEGSRWPEIHRARRAILVVDLVESVRLMQIDEQGVVERWRHFVHDVRTSILPQHGGRMVKSLGDGMMLEFDSARDAITCAEALNSRLQLSGAGLAGGARLQLRSGLHVAEVLVDEIDLYGAAVNLTARLGGLAEPDGIVASVEAVDEIVDGVDADVEDLGECYLKHLAEPVRAYRVAPLGRSVQPIGARVADPPQTAPLGRCKLAVLTLSGAAAELPLRSLLADEMSLQLSAHSSLDVVSRMSMRHAQLLDPAMQMRQVGADYALAGSCSGVGGGRMVLMLELVFARDLQVVWRDAVEAPLGSLIAAPADALGETCRAIMAAIEAHETGRARSMPLASLGSYSLLMGGLRLMHRLSRRDFDRSYDVFEALVARHPRHAEGYAWLAKWHILELHQGWSADGARSAGMAHDMARRALDRDDLNSVAMVVTGMVRTYADRRLDEAERGYEQLLAHHPNEALGWLLKGMVHAFRGEGERAVEHAERACALSPLDPMRYYFDSLRASAYASAERYADAVEIAERSLSANRLHASTLRILVIAQSMLDRGDAARETVGRLLALEPDFTVTRFLQRAPSADFEIGKRFAQALGRAGVPP